MSISVHDEGLTDEEHATPRSAKSVKRRTRDLRSAIWRRAQSKQKVMTGSPLWDQSEAVGAPEADNVGSNALVSTVCNHRIKGKRSRALGRLSNETTFCDDGINSIGSYESSSLWNDDKGSRT